MLPKDQQSLIDSFIKALNQHDLQAFQACYAEDCSVTIPEHPQQLKGRDAVGEDFQKTLAAFPDMKYTLKNALASGNTIAAEIVGSGTHAGNSLELPIAVFQKINNEGLIAQERRYYDMETVQQYLREKAA